MFILPKNVLRAVEQRLSSFLWNSLASFAIGTKINWDLLCKLKSEGGLGLKRIEEWIKTAIRGFIWSLYA